MNAEEDELESLFNSSPGQTNGGAPVKQPGEPTFGSAVRAGAYLCLLTVVIITGFVAVVAVVAVAALIVAGLWDVVKVAWGG